jgi:hypothetical protein
MGENDHASTPAGGDLPPACRVCHRPLRATASVAAGIGPVCARRRRYAEHPRQLELPLGPPWWEPPLPLVVDVTDTL